jgi:protein-tyrosine-phosphatase
MDAPLTLDAPPSLLRLAGHPLRWRLLGELALSDRVVSELTQQVGEPQNLVSYHLGKLREAGLVTAHRSEADRRDTYYGLDLARLREMLSAAGGALHPGLRLEPPEIRALPRARVLFLCSGNSARSQMAEAMARSRSGGAIEAHSAGSRPKAMHPNAIRVMREAYGLDLAGQTPKSFTVYAERAFDWVVSLCDRVREVCPEFPHQPRTIHWSIANPATGEGDEVTYPLFQAAAAKLSTRIDFLLARIAEPDAQRTKP